MKMTNTARLTGSALCMALGIVFPMIFHVFGAGPTFLPMHIPVLLCGLLFGWQYGAVCGVIVPLLSSICTGMPPIFPTAVVMVFELCAYGILSGLFYQKLRWNVYPALLCAMLGGRVVSGLASAVFYGVAGKAYGFMAFVSGAFVTALPGIAIQIVFLPVIVMALGRAKLFQREQA